MQKNANFRALGAPPLDPPFPAAGSVALQPSANGGFALRSPKRPPPPQLQISGCALIESNHVFALLIFMPRFESISFYQNKLKT